MKLPLAQWISFSKIANLVFFAVLIFLLVQRLPQVWKMYSQQGRPAPRAQVTLLDGSSLNIPMQKRQVLIFWATWCGPCQIELARINQLVRESNIPAESVLAISVSENLATVMESAKERGYVFPIALDPKGLAASAYEVAATPTILLIDESGQVHWMTMGLSPSLGLRLKSFLNP